MRCALTIIFFERGYFGWSADISLGARIFHCERAYFKLAGWKDWMEKKASGPKPKTKLHILRLFVALFFPAVLKSGKPSTRFGGFEQPSAAFLMRFLTLESPALFF